ncbi:MAG: ATP-binding protein [Lysinibacillus sp.]
MLTYWTRNYVLTLVIGLAILFILSALWIRHTTTEHRVGMMELIAEETVGRITKVATGVEPEQVAPYIDRRESEPMREINPVLYITDTAGEVVTTNRPFPLSVAFDFEKVIRNEDLTQRIEYNDTGYTVVKRSIIIDEEVVGYVLAVEENDKLTEVKQEFGLLALVILIIGLLGWMAIYTLSKRLSKPILDVAAAAKLVEKGDYQISLPNNLKEKEVDELVTSFKEMTMRLEQLEKMRAELLAGVTHELKTPVTSIIGLLQAVKDEVVTEEEAKDFIKMAYDEATKMKTMVGDLLAFNSFAVDAVPVKIDTFEVNELVGDVVRTWGATHPHIDLRIHILPEEEDVSADFIRIRQILVNLLTNAEQALDGKGAIDVSLHSIGSMIAVDVKDHGCGIPVNEQALIFERFYRGEHKKYKVRGLGLGLALSKMMAQSIGGDLSLVDSSGQGTTFRLTLCKSGLTYA